MKTKKEKIVENAKKADVKDAVVDRDTRNKAGFLIVGFALLVLICCGIYWSIRNQNQTDNSTTVTDSLKFKNEYEEFNGKHDDKRNRDYLDVAISKDNPIVYASFEQTLDLLENGTGVIYFGFPDCPWCRNLVPNLIEAAENLNVEKIYYLNALEDRDILSLDDQNKVVVEKKGSENYQKLLEKLAGELSDYILTTKDKKEVKTGEKRLYFPTVVVVKEGDIIGFHEGTVESQKDSSVELTNKQKQELVQLLEEKMQGMFVCDGAC